MRAPADQVCQRVGRQRDAITKMKILRKLCLRNGKETSLIAGWIIARESIARGI